MTGTNRLEMQLKDQRWPRANLLTHTIEAKAQAYVEPKPSHSLRIDDTAEASNEKNRKEKKYRRR